MPDWDRAKAISAFEALELSGSNAALGAYWLSLWNGDRPPSRSLFNPARVRDLLPAIALIEVHANGAAVCRVAGHVVDLAAGGPLTGANIVMLVDGLEQQKLRMARLCGLVDGQVALSRTQYIAADHKVAVAQTVMLPFCGEMENGSRQYLTHTDWRPCAIDYRKRPAAPRLDMPAAFRSLALV
jgi:hypothetical protein